MQRKLWVRYASASWSLSLALSMIVTVSASVRDHFGEEPVLPSDHHRLDRALRHVVVDGYPSILEEERDGGKRFRA